MPKTQINLLPKDDFEKKPIGKFLMWALNVGRWIVVFTELIVILAFLSRFKLDQDISDLYDRIKEKQAIVAAYSSTEADFLSTQKRLDKVQQLEKDQIGIEKILNEISQITPQQIIFKNLAFSEGAIKISATAATEASLGQFLVNLSSSGSFEEINITNISKGIGGEAGIQFVITAKIKEK